MVIMTRECMRLFPLRLPPPPPLRRPSAARAVQVGEAAGGRGARGEGEGERGAALAVTKLGESQLEAATAQSNARMEAVLLLSLAVVVLLPLTPGRGSADGISNYRMQKRAVK